MSRAFTEVLRRTSFVTVRLSRLAALFLAHRDFPLSCKESRIGLCLKGDRLTVQPGALRTAVASSTRA